ncbi:MAG: hypothetical protein IPP82_16225 [Xanthomonadales bacterium]|nr:hypothetical protein [Xanthomonadales bacterium]
MAAGSTGQPLSLIVRTLLIGLGVIWASPNTLIGLVAGVLALAGGAKMHLRRRDLAIVFDRVPFGPGGAMTLGNCILHTGDTLDTDCSTYAHQAGHGAEPPVRLCDHERAHVYQAMVLGPLFLPVYLLSGGISVRNRFERAADRYAQRGHGWWPWPTMRSPNSTLS